MNLWFWVTHPRAAVARGRYWWWEKRNPDKPWLTPAAVAFLDAHLKPAMTGLEFGSGRSTAWYAGKLHRLTSVEHHAEWRARVVEMLARRNISNVEVRLVPLDHPAEEPERATYDPLPAYVAVATGLPDESLDLVVVDGHYRSQCIAAVVDKLRSGGLLLVDDADRWPGAAPPVPAGWPEVSRTTNGIKSTVIWRKPG